MCVYIQRLVYMLKPEQEEVSDCVAGASRMLNLGKTQT
jgi:hypothetical protein